MKLGFLVILTLSNITWASIPKFKNLKSLNLNKGIYFSDSGFKIHSENTNWYQIDASLIKSKNILAEYKSLENDSPGKLTVRSENLKKEISLPLYIKRSVKDYRRFGFKILDLRPLVINNNQAFVVDLEKTQGELQTRQVLFKKKNHVVILTCTGHRLKFQSDLKSCNQIARNFSWVN